MISHGVLDSMPFNIARSGLLEISRCLKDKGKIYFDLISEHGYICSDENFEKTITTNHEKNTIQTCFNKDRINSLIDGIFNITEIVLKTEKNLQNDFIHGRYHIVVEKILNE